ncbi:hypothetical protein DSL72_007213 [Monilinia vaccinii-corymbosi]|uniref:Protamine P1 n=1 Tax=Monilinia vaccinii-corymbosi TaxID=61207 RepID=A0A8A3PMB8_9HELO|nr:hypothetical protein DSL72_007213 [Monilinia vaccinii-corymbosi]
MIQVERFAEEEKTTVTRVASRAFVLRAKTRKRNRVVRSANASTVTFVIIFPPRKDANFDTQPDYRIGSYGVFAGMSLHMSALSFLSDNDDEPIYFTPTYKPEDLICEGSDTEANPKAIIEKRRRYEECAERVLRGQLPVLESARLRGPLYKENKNEWVNPWRHREGDWWKPGSNDMLFRREDVMRRAREHGRNDMSPTEALAWCRRDAKRQAKEMGIEDNSYMRREPATRLDRERFVLDETVYGDIAAKEEGAALESNRSLSGPPLPGVPESTFLTHANTKDYEDTPTIGGSISTGENYGRQPETWTNIKRPVDVAWLKGSHVSKRARWEDPAVSSPTPLPHATSQKFQQKVTGTTVAAQNRTTHAFQPRSVTSLETPWQELVSQKSFVSLQQLGKTFDTEASFHTNVGRQGQKRRSISVFESGRKPANLYGDPPEPYSSIPIHTLGGKPASTVRASATNLVTSPRLPSHSRVGAIHDENHKTPGNVSFVTDVAPSSVNLEQFQFRKKCRRKTDAPEVTSHPLADIGERSRVPSSEGSGPNSSLQSDAILSTPFIRDPIDKSQGPSLTPTRHTASSMTKGSSRRSSRVDESWLTTQEELPTQEEVRITPLTRDSESKRTIEGRYSPLSQNFDDSWVTTQDDFDHAPKSSASMDITQIYRSSNSPSRPNLVGHRFKNYKHGGSLPSSPPQPAPSPSKSSPHLPALLKDLNKLSVPYNDPDGSSTQSYITSPVSSINGKLRSPQTDILPQAQDSGYRQQLSNRTSRITNEQFTKNTRDDNLESGLTEHVQVSDDGKEVETKEAISEINVAFESEKIEEITVLQADQLSDINTEIQVDLEAPVIIEVPEDVSGVAQGKMQGEVQKAMRAEPNADDVPNSEHSSGQTSTSSSPARTNNLTVHNLTSIHKARNVDQISKSSLSNQFTPLLLSEEDVISPASTQDLTEHLLEITAGEAAVAIASEDAGSCKVLIPDLQSKDQSATQTRCPQSPWASAEAAPLLASKVLAAIEMVEPHSDAEFPHSGWQKEECPVTTDDDIITPFSDFMTPSPPLEALDTPGIEQRPSNTQLLVEAATKNPWVNGSKKKSTKRKCVSFGVLDDEDSVQSQPRSQRQRRSPSPESMHRTGACGSKVAEFDDDVTDMNSFQGHFSAIRKMPKDDGVPKINNSIKRPSSISKYKATLLGAPNLVTSSPAIDAMAEAFIAADRESSRERDRHLMLTPSRNQKPKKKGYTTFHHEDEGDSGIQPFSSRSSTNAALNETSSNAKVAGHTAGDFLDEVEDFLGGDWSVEGELKKATGTKLEMVTPKGGSNVHSPKSIFALEENVWS